MNDPYAVLGVSSSASEEEIKRASRSITRTTMPITLWPTWPRPR